MAYPYRAPWEDESAGAEEFSDSAAQRSAIDRLSGRQTADDSYVAPWDSEPAGKGSSAPSGILDDIVGGAERVLAPVGHVLGATKSGVDWLARKGAEFQGIAVQPDDTTGRLLREGLGYRPTPSDSIPDRLIGTGLEFAGDIATDPLTWALGGATKIGALGKTAKAALAAGDFLVPEAVTAANAVAKSGRVADMVGRGAAAAFLPGMTASAIHGGAEAVRGYEEGGLTPDVAEHALGAGLSGAFALGAGRHALGGGHVKVSPVDEILDRADAPSADAAPPVSVREAIPTLDPEILQERPLAPSVGLPDTWLGESAAPAEPFVLPEAGPRALSPLESLIPEVQSTNGAPPSVEPVAGTVRPPEAVDATGDPAGIRGSELVVRDEAVGDPGAERPVGRAGSGAEAAVPAAAGGLEPGAADVAPDLDAARRLVAAAKNAGTSTRKALVDGLGISPSKANRLLREVEQGQSPKEVPRVEAPAPAAVEAPPSEAERQAPQVVEPRPVDLDPNSPRNQAVDATLKQMENRLRSRDVTEGARVPVKGDGYNGPGTGRVEGYIGAPSVKHELGLAHLKESPKRIAAGIKKDADNPIYLEARAVAESADPFGFVEGSENANKQGAAPIDRRGPEAPVDDERRRDSIADRRTLSRRERIAAEENLPLDSPTVERILNAEVDRRTGLWSKPAFDRDIEKHTGGVGTSDMGGTKWMNDTLGHPAGDKMIEAKGQALLDAIDEVNAADPEAKLEGYRQHGGGDETAVLGRDQAVVDRAYARAKELFNAKTFTVDLPDGRRAKWTGGVLDYGTNEGSGRKSYVDADTRLTADRKAAEVRGDRVRGAKPETLREVPSEPTERGTGEVPEEPAAGVKAGVDSVDDPNKPKYATSRRPAPGQRGLDGIGEDVQPTREATRSGDIFGTTEKTKAGEQRLIPGTLDAAASSKSRPTEGREAEGPLFTQELDAEIRADKARQRSITDDEKLATAEKPNVAPTLNELHKRTAEAFPKSRVTLTPDGIKVSTAGPDVLITPKGEIVFDASALESGHGAKASQEVAAGERVVSGVTYTEDGKVRVDIADIGKLDHEVFHVFEDHFARPAERAFMRESFGREAKAEGRAYSETAADAYNEWRAGRRTVTGPVRAVFERIKDFVYRAARAVGIESREGLFREVESGRAYERKPLKPIPPRGEKYATAPVLDDAPKKEEPLGRPMKPSEAPRVEAKAESVSEAKPDVKLSRDAPRTWESLDPEIRSELGKVTATPEKEAAFYNRVKSGKLNDVDTQVLDSLVRTKREAYDTSRQRYLKAQEAGAPQEASLEFLKASLDRVAADYAHAARSDVEAGTNVGRALAARARIMNANISAANPDAFMRKVFREIDGVTDAQAGKLLDVLRDRPADLQDALHAAMTPGKLNKFLEFWKAGLVSAPGTQVANVLGNVGEIAMRLGETATSSLLDPFFGGQRSRLGGEARYELSGAMKGAGKSLGKLGQALSDIVHLRPEEIDLTRPLEYQTGAIGGNLGRTVRAPFRLLSAFDDFFKGIGGEAELHKLAFRRAGGNAEAAAKIIANPPKDILALVEASKLARTFQNENTAADSLGGLRSRMPWLHIVMPFLRTPANIARLTVERSPLGFKKGYDALKLYREAVASGKDKAHVAELRGKAIDAMARPLVGTMLMATFGAVAKAGGMTGSGPTDAKDRNALKDSGWQPYSFVFHGPDGKNVYIPFNRFEPVSSLLGFAADMVESKDAKGAGDILDKGLGSVAQNLTSKTYLQGLADAAALLNDPKQFGSQYIRGLAGSLVPNIVAKTAQAIDPTMRDTKATTPGLLGIPEGVGKTLVSRLPGVSTMLPERRSGTGALVERPGNAVTRFLSPIQPSKDKPDADFSRKLVELDAVPTAQKKSIRVKGKDVMLTEAEQKIIHDADESATRQVKSFMRSPAFTNLPEDSQKAAVDSAYNRARTSARGRIQSSSAFQRRASAAQAAT